MPQAIPYLAFDGTCADAMRFYEATLGLGAKLVMLVSGADSPMADQMQPEHRHRILHGRIVFEDGSLLYAGDTPVGMPFDGMKGVTITMNYPTAAEAERVFAALAEGGQVMMPIGEMFYAKRAGMLVDRFGTAWAINGELKM